MYVKIGGNIGKSNSFLFDSDYKNRSKGPVLFG